MNIFLPQKKKEIFSFSDKISTGSFFVQTGEVLELNVFAIQPNLYFRVSAQIILPSGEFKLLRFEPSPAFQYVITNYKFPLTYCLLQSVLIETKVPNIGVSQFYCTVNISTSIRPVGFPVCNLTAGCVTTNTPLSYPLNPPRCSTDYEPLVLPINIPLLGPGGFPVFTNTYYLKTRFVALYTSFETSVVVGNRYVYVALYDPLVSPLVSMCVTPQIAGATAYYNFEELHPAVTTINMQIVSMAKGFICRNLDQFYLCANGMDVDDVFNDAYALTDQWIDV